MQKFRIRWCCRKHHQNFLMRGKQIFCDYKLQIIPFFKQKENIICSRGGWIPNATKLHYSGCKCHLCRGDNTQWVAKITGNCPPFYATCNWPAASEPRHCSHSHPPPEVGLYLSGGHQVSRNTFFLIERQIL